MQVCRSSFLHQSFMNCLLCFGHHNRTQGHKNLFFIVDHVTRVSGLEQMANRVTCAHSIVAMHTVGSNSTQEGR